jgi:hypothetical protein
VSETTKKLNLDTALRDWPSVEDFARKSTMDWENQARLIEERVRSGATGSSAGCAPDENLFAEPLGQTEEEGHNSAAVANREKAAKIRVPKGETMTMPVDRERDRRSLQDLAKLASGPLSAMTPPPPSVQTPPSTTSGVQRAVEAKGDDSGLVDLAMAAQSDPHAAARALSTPLANAGLFDEEPLSVRPAPVALLQPAPTMPPLAAPSSGAALPLSSPAPLAAEAANATSSAERPVAKKGNGTVIALVLGGLVAAGAIAAGGLLFVKHKAEAALKEQVALNAPVVVAAPVAPAPVLNTAPPTPSVDPTPAAVPETKDDGPKAVAKTAGGALTAPQPVVKLDKPTKDETAKLSAKDLPTTPSGPEGDLGKAMGAAVGAEGKASQATPAAGPGPQFAAGSVPQKPSQGAVTGAIGAVLPGARACLGPDDPVSRAAITFTSAGTVQSVSVSGGAAGKAAEGCIKGALSKAKLAPFAEPTYTANITVRH